MRTAPSIASRTVVHGSVLPAFLASAAAMVSVVVTSAVPIGRNTVTIRRQKNGARSKSRSDPGLSSSLLPSRNRSSSTWPARLTWPKVRLWTPSAIACRSTCASTRRGKPITL